MVRTGGYTTQIPVRVWIPENRLDIEMTDTKLSRIKGWSIPIGSRR